MKKLIACLIFAAALFVVGACSDQERQAAAAAGVPLPECPWQGAPGCR